MKDDIEDCRYKGDKGERSGSWPAADNHVADCRL